MDIYKIFKKYKLKTKDGQIFDPIRNKYVHLTPEEIVRQQTIQFLIKALEIPVEKLGVEVSLNTLGDTGNRKRIDICIYGENSSVLGIVECKANYIGINEAPYQQVIDYANALKNKWYFVVDSYNIIGYYYDKQHHQFVKSEILPHYSNL